MCCCSHIHLTDLQRKQLNYLVIVLIYDTVMVKQFHNLSDWCSM